jgi:hypothetical protein
MDPNLRESILHSRRARDIAARDDTSQRDVTLEEVRSRYGDGISDEELITRVYANLVGGDVPHTDAAKLPRTYAEYRDQHAPAAVLLGAFAAAGDVRELHFSDGQVEITGRR